MSMMNPLSKANVLGSNRTAGGPGSFFRTNFSFNKLEDEQIITQNEHVTDSVWYDICLKYMKNDNLLKYNAKLVTSYDAW